jgi:hypothetical protein
MDHMTPKERRPESGDVPMTDEEFRAALLAPRPPRDFARVLPNRDTHSHHLDDLLNSVLEESLPVTKTTGEQGSC